eukprot:symbB.v1.2.023694.t1/scaffold2189.1/size92612/4
MQEIFDTRTLAGQAVTQRMARAVAAEEQCPVETDGKDSVQLQEVDRFGQAICEAFIANRTKAPRLLLLGRLARVLARNLEQKDVQCQANRNIPEPKFWQRFQFLTSMMLRFASRLVAFPSAGRQAALRALTKPVQLAAAPTIASQVRGHAGQTMQEMLVANMDLPMGA